MEYQKCYVFEPQEILPRPKKRKFADRGLDSWNLRNSLFKALSAAQTKCTEEVIHNANTETITRVTEYINQSSPSSQTGNEVPSCLVTAGPNLISHGTFFRDLSESLKSNSDSILVSINNSESPNLKTILKYIIANITDNQAADVDDEHVSLKYKGRKMLNYDLQIVQDWLKGRNVNKIVIALEESEAFDNSLIGDIIEIFSYWIKKISFVLLFGIATSVENFVGRLPSSAAQILECKTFDIARADDLFEEVFCANISKNIGPLWLGPTICDLLIQRQKDFIQPTNSIDLFIRYSYMCHFYANDLSVFLSQKLKYKDLEKDQFEAVRNLPSFRKHVEFLLEEQQAQVVKELLESDMYLFNHIREHIEKGQDLLSSLTQSIEFLALAGSCFSTLRDVPQSSLYVKAFSDKIIGTYIIRDLSLAVQRANPEDLCKFLKTIKPQLDQQQQSHLSELLNQARNYIADTDNRQDSGNASHDCQLKKLKATKSAQRLQLNGQDKSVAEQDPIYTSVRQQVQTFLESFIAQKFFDPRSIFLIEVLMFDLKLPLREAFMPRPRFAIERALSVPNDYLNYTSSSTKGLAGKDKTITMSPSNPSTSILYKLYTESGALINLADLWSAYNTVIDPEGKDDPIEMAQFQRSLSELKYFGYVKPSRKKIDHIAKLAWKGL